MWLLMILYWYFDELNGVDKPFYYFALFLQDGEVDCWPLQCPSCSNSILDGLGLLIFSPISSASTSFTRDYRHSGTLSTSSSTTRGLRHSCCPPCRDETRVRRATRTLQSSSSQPCLHGGILLRDGQVWVPGEPECALCACKVSFLVVSIILLYKFCIFSTLLNIVPSFTYPKFQVWFC